MKQNAHQSTIDDLKQRCQELVNETIDAEVSQEWFQKQKTIDVLIETMKYFGEECDYHDFRARARGLSREEYDKVMGFDKPHSYFSM